MFGTLIDDSAIEAPLQGSVVGTVVASGTAIIENDLVSNPGFHQTADEQTGFKSRNLVCTPIKGVSTGSITGAVEVLNKLGGPGFGQEDLVLLDAVAAHLSVALDNMLITGEI
jgi:GAF domain-containing protein